MGSTPFLPLRAPLFDFDRQNANRVVDGLMAFMWQEWARAVTAAVQTHRFALADQPVLGAADVDYLAYVTDYGHLCRFTGTVWEFAPGDVGNKFFRLFAGAPQEAGWKLADGTATTFLTVGGATLVATPFNTPNLAGTPAYLKSAAAYAGLAAAVAPGIAGSTANATATISGSTANESAHTHSTPQVLTGGPLDTTLVDRNLDLATVAAATGTHTHQTTADTTGTGSAHAHAVGTLAVDNHLHAVGTLAVDATGEPQHVDVLMYFRR